MRRIKKKSCRIETAVFAPLWSRRSFGKFASAVIASVAVWRPRVTKATAGVADVEAKYWEPIAEDSKEGHK